MITLSLWAAISLFVAMAAMAAVPSLSVLLVASRAAAHGMRDATAATLGIVLADIAFILLALFGLSLIQQTSGAAFALLRLAGALWLLALAYQLCHPPAAPSPTSTDDPDAKLRVELPSRFAALSSGFVLTIGDQKAVLFYLGFMPAFVDVEQATVADAAIIALIATVAVGGMKLLWAWAAHRATSPRIASPEVARMLRRVAAMLLLLTAGYVLYGTLAAASSPG